MRVIGMDEIEDFEAAIQNHERNKEDYELSERPDLNRDLIIGSVTVKNKKSGATKTYRVGNGSAWVLEFEKDLEAGSI